MNSSGPEKTVRWGILGTAKIATKVGRAIHQARRARLAAVASRDIGRARAWVAEHTLGRPADDDKQAFLPDGSAVETFGGYLDLLKSTEIDAVYIPLPPALHCEWTCRAAELGKHVLCEKPLAMDHAEAEKMAAACAAQNRQLMDGVMFAHHDRTAAIEELLPSGEVGRLRRVTSAFSFNAADFRADNIRFQRELGGGALADVGWYCIRATLWAFGDSIRPFSDLPERVFATARYERDVDMNLSATLWFKGNRMASFDCGFDTSWRKWLEIAGTNGSIVCDDFVVPWDISKARFWVHSSEGKVSQHVFPDCVQEVRMIEKFCEIVRSGRLERLWVDAALATQKVCDAVARSARTARIVEL